MLTRVQTNRRGRALTAAIEPLERRRLMSAAVRPLDSAGNISPALIGRVSEFGGSSTLTLNTGEKLLIDAIYVTSVLPVAATSTTLTVSPLYGQAVVDTSAGTISYLPDAGFLGTDSLSYTVADTAGDVSDPFIVTIKVGTLLTSSGARPRRSVSFTDAGGGKQTIALNRGTAQIDFTGSGFVTGAKKPMGTPPTPTLEVDSIAITGTSAASVLSIRGSTKTPVTVNRITDVSALGSVVAPSATVMSSEQYVQAPVSLASVSSVQFRALSDVDLTTTGRLSAPVRFDIGSAAGVSIATSQTISTLIAGTWQTGSAFTFAGLVSSITAPVIRLVSIAGAFAGTVHAQMSAGSLFFHGGFAGEIATPAVESIDVTGALSFGSAIDVGTAKSIVVTGEILNSDISSVGDIGSISAEYLRNTTLHIGGLVGSYDSNDDRFYNLTLTNASAGALGSATLGSVRLISRSQVGIQNSSILAGAIGSAAVGVVEDTPIFPEGIAAAHLRKVTGTVNGKPLVLAGAHLASEAALAVYLAAHGFTSENYDIVVAE